MPVRGILVVVCCLRHETPWKTENRAADRNIEIKHVMSIPNLSIHFSSTPLVLLHKTGTHRSLSHTRLTYLQFHHGVLTHFVPPGFGYIVHTNQLGLVPHAVSFEPGEQVLIRLLWAGYTWRNRAMREKERGNEKESQKKREEARERERERER